MPAGYDSIGKKTLKGWAMKPKARAGRGNPPALRGAWKLQRKGSKIPAPAPKPKKDKGRRAA